MSRRIIFSMLGAGAMLVGSASDASAFEMLGRMLGGGCCAPEPSCGCAAPAYGGGGDCCGMDSCRGHRRGLFHGLFHGHRGCGGCYAEPACGCAAEPACGIAMEPACGCAAEPACGCAPSGCDPCGRRHRGLFGGLFHRGGCGGCGGFGCGDIGPACGCAAEPLCGCAG